MKINLTKKEFSFYEFVVSELPNILQIMTIPTVLAIIMHNFIFKLMVGFIIAIPVSLYLNVKKKDYMITNNLPYSSFICGMLFGALEFLIVFSI